MTRKVLTLCLGILLALVAQGFLPGNISFAAQQHHPKPVTPHRACPKSKKQGLGVCNVMVMGLVAAPKSVYGFRAQSAEALMAPGGNPPYTPANLHTAYNLPYNGYSQQTIAIVDAYDDPNAEADMNYYRATFGIPTCTSSTGCFRKVNEYGATSPLPSANASWGEEISLDLDMVSAICNNCHIILVEGNSDNLSDLGPAVNTAVNLGANVVSNSYGSGTEFSDESYFCNTYYNHPRVAITASTGDDGPGVQAPAVCPNVVAVGGTTLQSNGTETPWSGAGGGCSAGYIAKPTWQSYVNTNCPYRAVADISAVADPYTGVYVFDSYDEGGWLQMGGTSASAPIIAGVYGLAGNAGSIDNVVQLLWEYKNSGIGCINNVPTNSATTYAYQTGLGSPNNITCF